MFLKLHLTCPVWYAGFIGLPDSDVLWAAALNGRLAHVALQTNVVATLAAAAAGVIVGAELLLGKTL